MVLALLTAMAISSPDNSAYLMRVVTYNIHHAEGSDGRVDLDRIVRVIQETGADVVCLQEVDKNLSRTGRVDMPKVLAEKLGMKYVFGANYYFDDGEYGNLTLSRFPIVASENIALPNPDGKEPRGCLYTEISLSADRVPQAPRFSFSVYNTHLGLSASERLAQAEAIVTSLKMDGDTCVVVGDMNEDVDAAGMKVLLERLNDTPAVFNSGEARETLSKMPKYTFSATNPLRRIDFILSKSLSTNYFVIPQTDDTRVASDHLPVVAEVYLKDPLRTPESEWRFRDR